MESIGSRVKAIRKDQGLTMKQFGARIGISDAAVSQIESGKNGISEQSIIAICKEFNVSEVYLRTGAEEMYTSTKRERELVDFANLVLKDKSDSFRLAIVKALLEFDPNGPEWEIVKRIYDKVVEDGKAAGIIPADEDGDKKSGEE